jgi:hypothetical protein
VHCLHLSGNCTSTMKYIHYNLSFGHGYMDRGSKVGNILWSLHDWVDSTGGEVVLRCTSGLGTVISAAAK